MPYTITEAAHILNVPATTLRYYDKEGLMPTIGRKQSGYRIFSEEDIGLLHIISCLKKTGMSIKEIRQFTDWVREGESSVEQRYQMFLERKRVVEAQMEDLQKTLELIQFKCEFYKNAVQNGLDPHKKKTEDCLDRTSCC